MFVRVSNTSLQTIYSSEATSQELKYDLSFNFFVLKFQILSRKIYLLDFREFLKLLVMFGLIKFLKIL